MSLAEAASLGAGVVPGDCQQRSRFGEVLAGRLREAYFPSWPSTSGKALLGTDVRVDLSLPSSGFHADAADRDTHAALVTSISQQRCWEGLRGKEGCCWRGLPYRCKSRRQ